MRFLERKEENFDVPDLWNCCNRKTIMQFLFKEDGTKEKYGF
jgi:hypothetical protein